MRLDIGMEGNCKKMELAEDIWKRSTADLLIQILARLPMKSIMRFRAVCKSWKEMLESLEFKQLQVSLSSTPAFLIVQERNPLTCPDPSQLPFLQNMWISTEGSYNFHRLSMDFLPSSVYVVASCMSLLCCAAKHFKLYICNPVTKTRIKLPERLKPRKWDFISLAFDTCTTCCTVIIGRNSRTENMGVEIYNALVAGMIGIGMNSTEQNDISVEIYDSKTNKWSQVETTVDNMVRPEGEGVYSNGKFYWVNEVHVGESYSVVAFDVEQREWQTIKGPLELRAGILSQTLGTTHVTSCKGHIVLACASHLCLWELITDAVEGQNWSPGKELDNEHNLGSFDEEQDLGCLTWCMDIAVNDSGCVLAFLPSARVTVWSDEGKILQKILFRELADLSEALDSHISVRAFQVNNIWWP